MRFLFYFKILIGLVILILFIFLGAYFIYDDHLFRGVLLCFFAVAISFYLAYLIQKQMVEVDKVLLAIYYKDFSLFPQTQSQNSTLDYAVNLYYLAKKENNQLTTYQNLYENILDKLSIGILILERKNVSNSLQVFYVNPQLLDILEVPKYKHWNFYQNKIPGFYNLVTDRIGTDAQEFLDISIDAGANHTYSLRTSNLQTKEQQFCIVTLESVQSIIEKKEKLAWNNLMRVISHELMNTLTPVNSLIDNLQYIANQEEISQNDHEEMKESLEIIHAKSAQLMSFIQDYRQVAELPKPVKAVFDLNKTITHVLRLMQPEFDKKEIKVISHLENVTLYADEKMIERVLINLLTNALYAFTNQPSKEVRVNLKTKQNRVILHIQDNGAGIDPKIKDKIFIPFFTTRKHGSGIGLTLSKSIIEAHNGYINFKSNEKGSLFEVVLLG
ncbi:GHKL domain-containing protein [Flavobacteriaceae bacterium Ap0902]|nr:GHKL domain-containing protein [Flavobacteriaceae bacterium Ap0902]